MIVYEDNYILYMVDNIVKPHGFTASSRRDGMPSIIYYLWYFADYARVKNFYICDGLRERKLPLRTSELGEVYLYTIWVNG